MGRWIRNTVAQIDMFLAGAELGLSSTYDFGKATPTPTPPGREGQAKKETLTPGSRSALRFSGGNPGLMAIIPLGFFRVRWCVRK
jgi:hypothetical protein